MQKGRVTIPTDENYVEGTKKIADLWGADAVRDCDGTHLPKNALEIADKVYNTYFVVRGDNAWADVHTDELQSVLLMTGYILATKNTVIIDLLKGYSHDQLGVNEERPKKYWQVFDRTSGELIGRAGISRRVIDDNECCELGYIIKGSRQRQGLGYEVGSEIVKYARDTLGIAELWLCTEEKNTASIALAGKLGFTLYGSSVYDSGNKGAQQCYLYKKEL